MPIGPRLLLPQPILQAEYLEFLEYDCTPVGYRRKQYAQRKVRAARFVRAINARGRREIIRIVGNEMDHKVDVIHMGVKLPDRSLETLGSLPIKSSERRKVVVCPANFVPVKGHQYLLRALAQLRAAGVSFTCWLFGTGPLEGLLRQEQSRLDLTDCVEFKGRLPHDELLRLFSQVPWTSLSFLAL